MQSFVRDFATKGFKGDRFRLRAAATPGVQSIDRLQLICRQFESNTSMFSATRLGLVDFGITDRPCGATLLGVEQTDIVL